MSACTCHLSKNYMAIKSLTACHAIPESRADLRGGLHGSDEVDNTCLQHWPAAVGRGDPPGARPPICTLPRTLQKWNCGNVFISGTFLLSEVHLDDQITDSSPPNPLSLSDEYLVPYLQNFAPPASSLPSTLPQITQPGCEASSLSPVLGKHRTPPPISDWLSTFSGEV